MPRPANTTQAQRDRDQGLARARRLTWWAAIGATGATALGAAIAAQTIPGHALGQAPAAAAAAAPTDSGTGATPADPNAGSLNPPVQQPQPGIGSGPVIVSGSS